MSEYTVSGNPEKTGQYKETSPTVKEATEVRWDLRPAPAEKRGPDTTWRAPDLRLDGREGIPGQPTESPLQEYMRHAARQSDQDPPESDIYTNAVAYALERIKPRRDYTPDWLGELLGLDLDARPAHPKWFRDLAGDEDLIIRAR